MDEEEGIEHILPSLTSPGYQEEADPSKAEKMATIANDYLAGAVKENPKRSGALAALSTHDPVQAAAKLRRAVKELSMVGRPVYDFQSTGPDGGGKEYIDAAKYGPFWKIVHGLDAPVYLEPRYRIAQDPAGPEPSAGSVACEVDGDPVLHLGVGEEEARCGRLRSGRRSARFRDVLRLLCACIVRR